jgi:hypothetical protein
MSNTPSLFTATSLALRRDGSSRIETLGPAIIGRDGAQIFIKSEKGVPPLPNPKRHRHMRWDAFVYVEDPDGLAAEFAGNGAAFSVPLTDTSDGLRGFEISDPDGYVLFFGRPR